MTVIIPMARGAVLMAMALVYVSAYYASMMVKEKDAHGTLIVLDPCAANKEVVYISCIVNNAMVTIIY